MIPVAEARARILAAARPTSGEWLPLERAAGRALAQPLMARLTQPPADMSAMDGYAVRGAEAQNVPARFKVIGSSAAGHGFAGAIGPGEAVRIFTGAPVPMGADTVVIQENVEDLGASTVILRETAPLGKNIRKSGADFSPGRELLSPGRRLDAPALALAAASGHSALYVRRRPRVALLATGDELVRPGDPPGPNQIVSSNGIAIAALIRAAGGEALDLGIAADAPDALARALAGAKDSDVLVTLGGASVGDHDLVRPALELDGVVLDFWKIAMRPGKPLMFGRYPDGTLVLGLPGNPVSALVCAVLYLRPLLLALQGLPPTIPEATAMLTAPLSQNDKRTDYLRAKLDVDPEGHLTVAALPGQDSALLAALASADALIRREPHAPAAGAGSPVQVIPLAALW